MLRYVVVYDIQDDGRRQQVHKILKNHGVAVQESVFEVYLRESDLARLQHRLLREIRPSEDSLIFYRLCAHCAGDTIRCGRAEDPFRNPVMVV